MPTKLWEERSIHVVKTSVRLGSLRALMGAYERVRRLLDAPAGSRLAAERRNLGVFAAILVLIALVAYVVVNGLGGGYRSSDWPNQMILSRLLFHDPAHLYQQGAQARAQLEILGRGGFRHSPGGVLTLSSPPWLGFLTVAFAQAGVAWGGILWSLLQLACLLAGLMLLGRSWTAGLYAAAGIPAWVMLANANPVGLVVLGMALCWRLMDSHPWLAGLALGLALIRPNVLIPLPFAFLMARNWRVLGGSAVALGLLVGSVEAIHPGLSLAWITAVVAQAGHIGADLTPAGIGRALGSHLGWLFSASGLVAGLALSRARGPSLLVACLLASPHALVQSLVLVSGGLAAGGRACVRELLLLNAGACGLVALNSYPLAVALGGSLLLLAFGLLLRRDQPAAVRRAKESAGLALERELAAVAAA